MASRRRREGAGDAAPTARSSALEQLRSVREGGGRRIDTFTLKEEEKIFDRLPEEEYALLVARRRLESKDFVVQDEDDALGYGDIGEEENWEVSGMPQSSEEDEDEAQPKKPSDPKKKRIVPGKKDKELKAAAALMGKQSVSTMFAAASGPRTGKARASEEVDNVLNDVLAGIGAADVDRNKRKHRRVGRPPMKNEDFIQLKRRPEAPPPEYDRVVEMEPEDETETAVEPEVEEPAATVESEAAVPDHSKKAELEADGKSEMEPVVKPEPEPATRVNPMFEPFRRPQGETNFPKVEPEPEPEFSGDTMVLPLDENGKLQFYFLDAYEEPYGANAGKIFLFGKVRRGDKYVSCCVGVGNMQRCLYILPSPSVFPDSTISCLEQEMKDDPAGLKKRLHELSRDLKSELSQVLIDFNVTTFSMEPVKRSYAFERSDVTAGANYYIKLRYPYKDPVLPSNLKGKFFSGMFGSHTSALELLLIKRKMKGPSWLAISSPMPCSSSSQISWCKVEATVNSPKDITVMESGTTPVDVPKLVVASLNLKTVLNQKNANEIVSASVVYCQHVKVDSPMPPSEWNNHQILGHFSLLRKLDGCTFPAGFNSEVTKFNTRAGSMVLSCEGSERALLNRLMIKLHQLDADVLVGHNISAFDLDVLLHRLQACKVPNNIWSRIGRLKRSQIPRLTGGGTSYGGGASLGAMTCVAGRLLCDTYLSSRELLKEVSYSLTELAKSQLNRDRKEITPSDIPNMHQSSAGLLELIEAAETDAWLSLSLMFHLSVLPLTRQLTNISGNLWSKTLQGARAQRVEYLLLHEFYGRKFIVPDKASKNEKEQAKQKRKATADEDGNEQAEEKAEPKKKGPAYLGGLVLEPKKGLYDKYILLLDFNSLYPSIIQEYNICFTTVDRPSDGSIPTLPSTDTTGVLPQVLRALVERRKQVKQWLRRTTDIMKCQQLDIQQQALKLTANSMYGCLGFPNSRFYAKSIAELITSQGREILQSTVDHVQNVLNLEVIYGDTDSIMINTGLEDIAVAKSVAAKVIKEINKKYKLLEIDLDGVFKRMLLLKKKKYASVKVEANADGSYREVIEQKGLEIVRRDWSVLSKEIGNFVLQQILSGGSREEVVDAIHNQLRTLQDDMRNEKINLEKYVITKSLTKAPEDYPDGRNQPHVQVALRRKNSGHRCFPGDTIPYIICYEEGAATASIAERARHPEELQKDKGSWVVDVDYYLSQQVHPVVSRLCAPIEGTDPSHIAECLGLDSSRFQQRLVSSVVDKEEALLSSSMFDDEDRYKRCEPLELVCPSCSHKYPFQGVSTLLGSENGSDNPLGCPSCSTNTITPAMLSNIVTQRAAEFIDRFYDFWMVCDDEMCNHTTRDSILRVVGDAEKGSVCPNYPRCNGHLVRQYTQADLYNQLTYFCRLLDVARAIDKIEDATTRMAAERRALPLRGALELADEAMKQLRDKCSFRWVQMNKLCIEL